MTRRLQFHLPLLQAVGHRAGHRQKIRHLVALEMHALGVRRHEHVKRLQPGVLDLILQVRRRPSPAPRSPSRAAGSSPGSTGPPARCPAPGSTASAKSRNASTPFCRMPDFCGSSCVTPSRAADLQPHPLLRHDQQRPALLARLAQHQLRHAPAVRRLHARPGQA